MAIMATGGKRAGRSRAWIEALWVGGLAATAVVAGCGGNNPPEQSGTQRIAGRDFDHLFFWNAQTPAFTRHSTAPAGASEDFWIWPDGETAPLLALSQVDWSPPTWQPELIVGDILMTDPTADRVYDLQTRTEVNLGRIAAQSAAEGPNWASVRRDGGSIIAHVQTGELFAGRGSAFTFLPAPYNSWGADFMGNDLVVLASPSASEPGTSRLYRMALPSGDLSAMPVAAFPPIPPICSAYAMPPCKTFQAVGCGADDAVCPETGRAPCAILYVRANTQTDFPQPYVFDVNTGQETALAGVDPSQFVISPDRHSAAWTRLNTPDLSDVTQSPVQTPIYVHDFCSGAEVQCPVLGPQQITWRRDGGGLFIDGANQQLSLVDVSNSTCTSLPHATIGQYGASPAGDRLAWIMQHNAVEPPQLWIGDATGSDARMVADDVAGFSFSPDGRALFITRISVDHLSLSWLLLGASSLPEQPIADAFSGATLRGNQRVLLIDHWNTQDQSGDLELVDLLSGTRQVLAHAVTDLAGSGSVDGAARVMYAVHGRFASAQDGLWQTTLPAP